MATKRIAVDLYYDVISPYSWIGFELLHRYKQVWTKMDLRLKPFLLGGVFKESNNKPPAFVPAKAAYMPGDIKLVGQCYGVPIQVPSNFPELAFEKGSLNAMRFVASVDLLTKGSKTEDISRAFWKRIYTNEPGKDISEASSLEEAGSEAGLTKQEIDKALSSMTDEQTKGLLKANTAEAIKNGAFGAPTIVVNKDSGPVLLFGSDRIEVLAYILGESYQGPLKDRSKL